MAIRQWIVHILFVLDCNDTVRTRIYTGKPARLLKTKWTEAWAEADAPEPLPMPLQNLLVAQAHNRINASNDPDVISMPIGQIVGRMNEVRPVVTCSDTTFHNRRPATPLITYWSPRNVLPSTA